MRNRLVRGLIASMFAAGVGLAGTAQAAQAVAPSAAKPAVAGAASLDGTWACFVPDGYTFDKVESRLGQCGSGFATRYRLRTPADLVWACFVPDGFTFDMTQNRLGQCSERGFATSYRLRG